MEICAPTCLYCSSPISPQERVVVIDHDGERETQLAREPELPQRAQVLLVHATCAPAGWTEQR